MSDFYINLGGDLVVNGSGDLALVQSMSEKDIQHVYMRLMTEPGDFFIYPQLGTQLSMLYRTSSKSTDWRFWQKVNTCSS